MIERLIFLTYVLFAEYGLSGIPIFQISRFVAESLHHKQQVTCVLDLLPQFSSKELEERLYKRCKTMKQRTAEEVLTGLLNHKLNYILLNIPFGENSYITLVRVLLS